jgi:hypothetical protein
MADAVHRLFPGSTVVCLGTGPSLRAEDVSYCRGRAKLLAVKDAYRLAPDADVLYSGEIRWWRYWAQHDPDGLAAIPLRYSVDGQAHPWATILQNSGIDGLETDPSGLRTGENSGYQAVGLAVHLGASKIVLLGYDFMANNGKLHFFGNHPYQTVPTGQLAHAFHRFMAHFATLVEPLKRMNIAIVNATRETALTCFPQMSLAEALA